jgi:hypothetical protein
MCPSPNDVGAGAKLAKEPSARVFRNDSRLKGDMYVEDTRHGEDQRP